MFSQCFGILQVRKNEIALPKWSSGTQPRRHRGGGFGGLNPHQTSLHVPSLKY